MSKNLFNYKDKRNNSVWPTIFPTSCISLRRSTFLIFCKYLEKNRFPYLEIDARLAMFSNFFLNEYNLLPKKLTYYSFDQNGITSNIKKFSKVWWIRRKQAYIYLKYIMYKKKIFFKTSADYYITTLISYFLKI